MNDPQSVNDFDFDRLVDGEMPPAEYRSFLQRLDTAPDGWKRLAHAFLEGQAWRADLAPPKPAPVKECTPTRRTVAWWMRPAPQWLAMAAVVMLAFALGMQADFWRDQSPSSAPKFAQTPVGRSPAGLQALGNMHVIMDRAGADSEPVTVPVYPSGTDPQLLWGADPSLGDLVKQYQASGHRVLQQRHYVPVHLEDGREVIMPVERIQFVPPERVEY